MTEVRGSSSWRDELSTLVEDTGVMYFADPLEISTPAFETARTEYFPAELRADESGEPESLKDQMKGFLVAWGEIFLELGRGCKDIVQQSLITEDSYIARNIVVPCEKASQRLKFLNEFLPEDRDPLHAWSVVFFVFILALAAISGGIMHDNLSRTARRVRMHPPIASRILLPDGRHMAYLEQGVSADEARFSIIAPHSFLSSRLAGIPGARESLLYDFGIRLVTYDIPGFGESDPYPRRNLNSSAHDMLHLASAVGVNEKFWVLGYSSGSMHAWAALHYIPDRVAGAIMVAPMISPYEASVTQEEMKRIWDSWMRRRKMMYILARRFPKFLPFFYRRSFLSGKHDQIDTRLSLSLGPRDALLTKDPKFEEFWYRDVEESIRQQNVKPLVEEAALLVSNWGFSLADLQLRNNCLKKGIITWLKSMYSQPECELAGFLGPIHIWQGMEDQVVPPAVADYIRRVLPAAAVRKLPNEGHFSFFFFCDECHRQMFTAAFGKAQGPLEREKNIEGSLSEESTGEVTNENAE